MELGKRFTKAAIKLGTPAVRKVTVAPTLLQVVGKFAPRTEETYI